MPHHQDVRRFPCRRFLSALLLAVVVLPLSAGFDPAAAVVSDGCAPEVGAQQPPLRVEARVEPCTIGDVGEAVTFSFTLSNSGSDRLSELTVQAQTVSGNGRRPPLVCRPNVDALLAGASALCAGDYVTTAADLEMQAITMTALVSATAADGERVSRAVTVSAHVVARVLVHPNGPVAGAPFAGAASTGSGPDSAPLLLALLCAIIYAVAVQLSRRARKHALGAGERLPVRHRRS